MISLITLFVVFVLIAVRQIGKVRLQIWQIMLVGAIVVLLTGQISFFDALKSIDPDVMLFLFGMFVIGKALEESGYLKVFTYKMVKRAESSEKLLFYIVFVFGFLSAFLMNDTVAIVGTPVVLHIAGKNKTVAKPFLLALVFAVTVGSVASPIGNPQNLLIALNLNSGDPFLIFAKYLFVPTLINLVLVYFLLLIVFKKKLKLFSPDGREEKITEKNLAFLSQISLLLLLVLVFLKIFLVAIGSEYNFRLTYIALISMLPVLLSKKRIEIVKEIDWHTLIFFAAMFILTESVWKTGFFQGIISHSNVNLGSVHSVLSVSIVLSQFISNVPLVVLYIPVLKHAGASILAYMALAAGSTIAGNISVLGAASNVIVIQNAEKRSPHTLSALDFVKIGVPLTVLNILVYWFFFCLF